MIGSGTTKTIRIIRFAIIILFLAFVVRYILFTKKKKLILQVSLESRNIIIFYLNTDY